MYVISDLLLAASSVALRRLPLRATKLTHCTSRSITYPVRTSTHSCILMEWSVEHNQTHVYACQNLSRAVSENIQINISYQVYDIAAAHHLEAWYVCVVPGTYGRTSPSLGRAHKIKQSGPHRARQATGTPTAPPLWCDMGRLTVRW